MKPNRPYRDRWEYMTPEERQYELQHNAGCGELLALLAIAGAVLLLGRIYAWIAY